MTLPAASGVVLDNNVVLDWLVFRDPWTRALEREITAVFAAAGALLFLGAGAASALLFGRLP